MKQIIMLNWLQEKLEFVKIKMASIVRLLKRKQQKIKQMTQINKAF